MSKLIKHTENFVKNRYTYLFAAILAIFISQPLLRPDNVLISLFFMLMMLAVLWTLELKKWFFKLFLILAFISFLISILNVSNIFLKTGNYVLILDIADIVTYIIFLFISIIVLLEKVFSERKVTMSTILGGISIYLLMGIFWAFCYQLVNIFNPDSILFNSFEGIKYLDFMFFSFTTLTTLGYGDIVPVSYGARNLAIIESTLGPIFLAVFIARLVGLHISQSKKDQ
jgi:hypothetical protein